MRDANWDDIFQKRGDDTALNDERIAAWLPWEDWLTFLITAVVMLSVVASIDGARWVSDMPSLYPIALSALVVGYGLSRVRVHEVLLHPLALLIGATLVFLQLVAVVPGGSFAIRTDHLVDRMHWWWSAVTQNGLSTDTLPFIVLVLVLTWVGTYVSTWAIFRWRNPWLGLVPGGTALMWNISFIPGQFSPAFVVFVFAAVLLLMRLHVARQEREWERRSVGYPEFISLSVLHVTFWATAGILVLAWLMPLAARSNSANQRWSDFTAPLTRRIEPLARVFLSINAKKPIAIHNLADVLPFQGKIALNGKSAVKVDVTITPDMAAFLRSQSFDQYTADGWKVNVTSNVPLKATNTTSVGQPALPDARKEITIHVTVQGGNNGILYSLGQPVKADKNAQIRTGADPADVSSLKPTDHFKNGDTYAVTGSVAVPSVDELRAAGTNYPDWVRQSYLQLPSNLPGRIAAKARDVTRSASTPYDEAAAIEAYVRTFPIDYNVPVTPPGRDTVDYFLFDLQRGYFDYHASAMAVMLRTLGIPARVASGYALDASSRAGGAYNLTERDAFAWPEVYFPNIGWVEFSPTPSQPLIQRPGTVPATTTGTPGSSRSPLNPENPDLGITSGSPATAPAVTAKPGRGASPPWLLVLAVIGGIVAVSAGGAKLAWEWGMGGLARPAQLWEKTARLATLAGMRPRPSETPREFSARLASVVPGTQRATELAAAYERRAFGQQGAAGDDGERIETAWRGVRSALARRVLRRGR
ncbi:MAG TPA: transglutaminase domain-containing protein [Dehalococcoidia bacterium]|nr:transglutaminase domain-containing protein [Dehalococcoidia bacterium]